MIEVRIANHKDADHIAKLGRITFRETFGHLFIDKTDLNQYLTKTFSVDKIKSGFKKTNNVFFIAFEDGLPVGYAKLKLNSKSEFIQLNSICQLQKIYVLKDFLSKKVGFHLQNLLFDKAKESNFENIWLSVLKSNERAINFYKKNDFKEVGDHEFQIGKQIFNFIVMNKVL
ncbi:N-acetyltransferase family protein [Winogradskyella sp. A2]|uniref:GNAT family N-acetyltransferase n=1 Tax=Winogradskyella sp. A2 TaxID=3366944 RepID=UPI00398C6B82